MTSYPINGWAAEDDEWDLVTGAPGIGLFSNAAQVWAMMQRRRVTVADAALAFNAEPARIIEAVNHHYWMFLSGHLNGPPTAITIEHEGE